jgi:hypothetical protein
VISLTTNITPEIFQTYLDYAPCATETNLESFFIPCFILKTDEGCKEIIISDETYYEPLLVIISNVTIRGSISYQSHPYGIKRPICNSFSITPDRKIYKQPIYGGGRYLVETIFNYVVDDITYSKNYEFVIDVNCCKEDIEILMNTIKYKIKNVSCKINSYEIIGKNTNELYKTLYLLENALFLLCSSKAQDYCKDAEVVSCFLNTLKNIC